VPDQRRAGGGDHHRPHERIREPDPELAGEEQQAEREERDARDDEPASSRTLRRRHASVPRGVRGDQEPRDRVEHEAQPARRRGRDEDDAHHDRIDAEPACEPGADAGKDPVPDVAT
jgi:hypothetical protein